MKKMEELFNKEEIEEINKIEVYLKLMNYKLNSINIVQYTPINEKCECIFIKDEKLISLRYIFRDKKLKNIDVYIRNGFVLDKVKIFNNIKELEEELANILDEEI